MDWIFAVALAFFVGVVVWFGRSIYDFFTPSTQTISTPTFVGQTESDAMAQGDRVRVRAVVVAHATSDRFPKGVVMSQEPRPGAQVRVGRQISLIVSDGLQLFPMPDLRYETLREATLDLSHDKLILGKTRFAASAEVPSGHVIAQEPPPLVSARAGTVVNLVLSKTGPSSVRVPDFVNLPIELARSQAQDSSIRLGQVVWTPFGRNGPPRGIVVRQSPDAGAHIDPSQMVSLQVSAGPGEAGYLVRQVHATVTVPSGEGAQLVRVAVHDETGTWNVYDAYAQSRQKLDFTLTVIGTSELDTYVNNELLGSTVVGVEAPEQNQRGPKPKRAP